MKNIVAVDLFCGAGGLTHGLRQSKVDVVAGIDIDESCRYAYEYNNNIPFYAADVATIKAEEINALYPANSIKLLAGCAPCQPFSKYTHGQDTRRDVKWPLLYSFATLIKNILPDLVTMENVPGVIHHQVYHDFVLNLKELGYSVWADKVYCPDYGIPQMRKRHVLLASKFGEIELQKPTHKPKNYRSVAQTISKLPPLKAGAQNAKDRLHRSASLSTVNLKRIKNSIPGGTWRDWPEDLIADCHKKPSGKNYASVYARMSWDQPSPTITTQCYGYGNGRFGHPEQDRAISLREAAMLQTFPKSYRFVAPKTPIEFVPIGMMIGNAVPVKLGKIVGLSLQQHLHALNTVY